MFKSQETLMMTRKSRVLSRKSGLCLWSCICFAAWWCLQTNLQKTCFGFIQMLYLLLFKVWWWLPWYTPFSIVLNCKQMQFGKVTFFYLINSTSGWWLSSDFVCFLWWPLWFTSLSDSSFSKRLIYQWRTMVGSLWRQIL